MSALVPHTFASSSIATRVMRALAPRPPYSSSTRTPNSSCSRKSSTTSHGNSPFLSISAARGAIRSRASVRTSSLISRCSSFSGSSCTPGRLDERYGSWSTGLLLDVDARKLHGRDPRRVPVDTASVRAARVRLTGDRHPGGGAEDLDHLPGRRRPSEEPTSSRFDLEAELLVEESAPDEPRVVLESRSRAVREIGRRQQEIRTGRKVQVRELGRSGIVDVGDLADVETGVAVGRVGGVRGGGGLRRPVGELEAARRALDGSRHGELLARVRGADADVAGDVLDHDLAAVRGGADVPVAGRPEVNVARVRTDRRSIELGGVVPRVRGAGDDVQLRGRVRLADADVAGVRH